MSDVSNDSTTMPAPVPDETTRARVATWRTSPPTADEVRTCQWWWHRTRDGGATIGPSVIGLDVDRDVYVAEVGGARLLPGRLGGRVGPVSTAGGPDDQADRRPTCRPDDDR